MSDEDEHDHSLLDRHHHRLMDLYGYSYFTTPARRQSASGSTLGIMVLGLLIWAAVKYWQYLLLALLALVALFASVFLVAWLRRPARRRQPQDRKRIAFERAKTATQIRITINSSPEYERYFWSPDNAKLVEQWRRYHEEGVKPIRRNKAAPATPATAPQPKATPLSPKAQKILAQARAACGEHRRERPAGAVAALPDARPIADQAEQAGKATGQDGETTAGITEP